MKGQPNLNNEPPLVFVKGLVTIQCKSSRQIEMQDTSVPQRYLLFARTWMNFPQIKSHFKYTWSDSYLFKCFIKLGDPLDTSLGVLIRFLFSSSKRTKTANTRSTTGSWATDKIKGEERHLLGVGKQTHATHTKRKRPCTALGGGGQQGSLRKQKNPVFLRSGWFLRLLKSFPPLIWGLSV